MEPAQPAKCCVKCNMIVCARCAGAWLKMHDRCPKKCTDGKWVLKNMPVVKFEYSCPYGCEGTIKEEEFEDHLLSCVFSPE